MTTKRGTLPGRVKAAEEKLTVGRPRKQPPADALQVIQDACALGASKQGVAMAMGVSVDVLTRWMDENAELKEAFAQGRERERQMLHDVLTNAAKNGNVVAAIFLTKARHGYREGDQESQANRVSINFQIPGALPLDRFTVIDSDPNH